MNELEKDRNFSPEDEIRFRIDDVLEAPEGRDLQQEYQVLANAYKILNRKFYKVLFISDIYHEQQMKRLDAATSSTPRKTHQSQLVREFESLLNDLDKPDPSLKENLNRVFQKVKKLESRFNKIVSISDRFQKQLQETSFHKDSFIANLSHELRNPLGTILGIGDLLKETDLNDEQSRMIQSLTDAGESLTHIIDDVLDLSRLEAGKISIEDISFDLRQNLSRLISQFEFHRARSQVDLNLTIDRGIPEYLIGDPHRLNQILSNLLSNALKFTKKGSVTLDASIVDHPNDLWMIQFRVIDTGEGIREDRLPGLFQRFEQEEASTSRRFGGSGLGLSIVKELTELMGGTVSVESKKNKGSTFSITIPFRSKIVHRESQEKIQYTITGDGDSENTYRILIAEDSPDIRLLMEKFLEDQSISITFVGDGETALEYFRENHFDLVLLDWNLPGLNGQDICETIRSEKNGQIPIPIVAVTGRTRTKEEHGEGSCFNEVITKPFRKKGFLETIQKYLNRTETGEAE